MATPAFKGGPEGPHYDRWAGAIIPAGVGVATGDIAAEQPPLAAEPLTGNSKSSQAALPQSNGGITVAMVTWRLKGEEAGGCNCAWGCPCQFNALPTHGRCEGVMTVRIAEGHFGTLRLDGVRFAAAFSFPGAMHEGNGTFQLILDERATTEQRDAVLAISGGGHGGTIFEIFAAVAPNRPAPLVLPVEIEADRERRTARFSLPGVVEYQAEPIKNPVTGEEHRAQIRLPSGFEYREAEMGNTTWLKVAAGPIAFEHHNSYAQFNAIDWSNEPA